MEWASNPAVLMWILIGTVIFLIFFVNSLARDFWRKLEEINRDTNSAISDLQEELVTIQELIKPSEQSPY